MRWRSGGGCKSRPSCGRWAQQHLGPGKAISLDGKALRGIQGEELPGVRLVAAYAHRAGRVLAQAGGPAPAGRGTSGG